MYRSIAFFTAVAGLGGLAILPSRADAERLGLDAGQMVVCIAPEESSYEGSLQLFHRDAAGDWQADGDRWPVLFARGGLAWGRGINPPQPGPQKQANDHRNPAGLFKIGFALGYAPKLPAGSHGWPYHQVTDRDAWIDDPSLPGYNHLYTLQPDAPLPPWWEKEHLHLGDNAYEWMLVIEHNYDQVLPSAGNEIFFHVRRGEHYRTAGCTTMSRDDLIRMIAWLQPGSNAMVAELSRADYARVWRSWHLPPARMALK